MSIVHATPGLLDIRAITTFGLHAKPGTDTPIGKFGTGLKYAISTLIRLGCTVRLFIGEVEYEFYTKVDNFRGMEFQQVYMKKRSGMLAKWRSVELPFTTMHGKHWEAWMAFRELHSNTLDEGGNTQRFTWANEQAPGKTFFVIEGDEYEQAYLKRDTTFLPDALTQREGDDKVQVFSEPSNHIYWRGIRVFDLEKPSVYTYNILEDVTLTEDRTLKFVWDAQSKIAAYVARSKDPKLINAVVSADAEKFFEGRLDWDYAYTSPSETFNEVLAKKKSRGSYVAPRALGYYDRYAPRVVEKKSETLHDKMTRFAYDTSLPQEVQDTFKHLLKCKVEEPAPVTDDDLPF